MAHRQEFLKTYLNAMQKYLALLFIVLSACESQADYPIWTEEDRALLVSEFQSTQNNLHKIVDTLSYEQWNFKADSTSWSVGLVVEHLQLQEDMHYREVNILSMQPPQTKSSLKTIGNDEKVNAYANDPTKGIADWNVTPLGRWPTKNLAMMAFDRSRDKMIELVKTTKADLRQQVTFRHISDETDFRNVRNLHQILLTTIAHHKRHMQQIDRIMASPGFPVY